MTQEILDGLHEQFKAIDEFEDCETKLNLIDSFITNTNSSGLPANIKSRLIERATEKQMSCLGI